MVDEPRLLNLLRRVSQDVAFLLERRRQDPAALATDRVQLLALRYAFVTAIEGAIRSAQHIAASEGWRTPATNADAFLVLAGNGVLPNELAGRLAKAAGFRNLLIHQYAEIDDQRVIEHLGSVGDLDAFVDAVTDWLATSQRQG